MRVFDIRSRWEAARFAIVISAISVALSVTVTTLAGVPGTPRNYTVAILAPSLIAPPCSLFMAWNMLRFYHLNQRLQHLLDHDQMTGLLVRASFFQRALALRNKTCAILLIDIDHFKRINDRFGHAVGDMVISEVGAYLQTWTATGPLAARFGGEEFVILLPGMSKADAISSGEKLIQGLAKRSVETREFGEIAFTASAGLAMLEPEDNIDQTLVAADTALYRAKESGRNQLCVAHVFARSVAVTSKASHDGHQNPFANHPVTRSQQVS